MNNKSSITLVSIVVPVYNEMASLEVFHNSLVKTVENLGKTDYEIIYCNDGSTDVTAELIAAFANANPRVKLLSLSRNFGKEIALSAGIAAARGEAIITIDGDGQHPVELIPEFISKWRKGAKVVVGVRDSNRGEGIVKKLTSKLFYSIFNFVTRQNIIRGAGDFRLIDRVIQQEFVKLTEPDRMTRALIDWIGFDREYIHFDANPRIAGEATYSGRKLIALAAKSFVALSPKPLYLISYLGGIVTFASFIIGSAIIIEQFILSDPLYWNFTGTAMLSFLLLFVVGIILMAQGLVGLYVSQVHNQTKGRPLFVVDDTKSIGVE